MFETVLMMGHKIYFYGEIWLIIQIRGGIEDNSKIIFLISQKTCCDLTLEPTIYP